LVTIIHCPYCVQTSTRKDNLKVHMRRMHGIEVKRTSANLSKNVPQWQGFHRDKTQFHSQYQNDTYVQSSRYQTNGPNHDPNDVIRGMVDFMKPVVEFKKNVEFIFGSTKPNFSFFPSSLLSSPPDQFAAPYPPPDTRIPFGYSTRLCYGCLKNVLVVVGFDREVDNHTCDGGINKSPSINDKSEIVKKLSEHSGDLLFHTVSTFQNSRFDILHAGTLSGNSLATRQIIAPNPLKPEQEISIFSENEKKIDLDLDAILHKNNGILTNYWLKNLVEEGWAKLDNADLYTYLHIVKTATFAFFRIKYKRGIKPYFLNLMGH
jgi:hypothetical protein